MSTSPTILSIQNNSDEKIEIIYDPEINDKNYLEWALENMDSLKRNVREAIKVQIDKLNNK